MQNDSDYALSINGSTLYNQDKNKLFNFNQDKNCDYVNINDLIWLQSCFKLSQELMIEKMIYVLLCGNVHILVDQFTNQDKNNQIRNEDKQWHNLL